MLFTYFDLTIDHFEVAGCRIVVFDGILFTNLCFFIHVAKVKKLAVILHVRA